MHRSSIAVIAILALTILCTDCQAQLLLFKEPRKGGFKFLKDSKMDVTHLQHFAGSGMLAIAFYHLFESKAHAKLKAGAAAMSLALLKEVEDGFREGFGINDAIFDQIGVISFLLLSDHLGYSLEFVPVASPPDELGAGVRFFQTKKVGGMIPTYGFFIYQSNLGMTRVGLDAHFAVTDDIATHFGMSLFTLQNPNLYDLRPNWGLSFRLVRP
ncbi:hypothetical protein MJD09_01400 [bacterium]|nr:hypothetical protein [bacterium]